MSLARRVSRGIWPVLAANAAFAAEAYADVGTQTTLGYSDNIDRLADGGRSERILSAFVGGTTDASTPDLDRTVRWEAGAVEYLEDTYDSEAVVTFDGVGEFAFVESRLWWHLEDQLGLQALDPFAPVTPDMCEYVNYFSTGPELVLPFSSTAAFTSALTLTDIQYQEQPLDSSRSGGNVGVRFSTSPNRSFGLTAAVQDVSFDDSELHSDYEVRQYYFTYQTQRRRSTLLVNLGSSELQRTGVAQDGWMLDLDWRRSIAARSSFSVLVRRGFSDAGQLFEFEQSFGGGTSDFIAAVSNPLEQSRVSLVFATERGRSTAEVAVSWDREDYVGLDGPLDREIPSLDARFSRELSPRVRLDVSGRYVEQDSLEVDQQDRERRLSIALAYAMGRRTELAIRLGRFGRSSTLPGVSYEENRVYVTFGYGAPTSGIQMSL
jgi:hypothetical protein